MGGGGAGRKELVRISMRMYFKGKYVGQDANT